MTRIRNGIARTSPFALIALGAIAIAGGIQFRTAFADDSDPGDPCTGTCTLFLPNTNPQFFDCGAGYCCCDLLQLVPDGVNWVHICCQPLFGDGGDVATCEIFWNGVAYDLRCPIIANRPPCADCPDLETQ